MAGELQLGDGLNLTRNGLGLFIEEHSTMVLADLHIGLEHALLGEGTYLPVLQYPTIEKSILDLVSEYSPERLIINGDLKHEFAKATNQEWTEILNLWDKLSAAGVELDIVRGNHDNFLINVLKQRGKSIIDPSASIGSCLITHGHKKFGIPIDTNTIILAHEHPALGITDESGGKHKFKCYLVGKYKNYKVIVLPAYSPLSAGTVINSGKGKKFMSPWLSEIDTSEFIPMVVDNGELLKFPQISEIDPIEIRRNFFDGFEID
jgi:putative SbcD/Mre11-related phosphoesterase